MCSVEHILTSPTRFHYISHAFRHIFYLSRLIIFTLHIFYGNTLIFSNTLKVTSLIASRKYASYLNGRCCSRLFVSFKNKSLHSNSIAFYQRNFCCGLRFNGAILLKFERDLYFRITKRPCKSLKKFANYFLIYADFNISIRQGSCSTGTIFVKF